MRNASFALAWLVLVALVLAGSGRMPDTVWQWLMVVVIGPPAYIALELMGGWLAQMYRNLPGIRHVTDSVEARTQDRRVSSLRILWVLVNALVVIALVIGLAWLYENHW